MRPYLHVSKKNLVAAPVEFHLNVRREEMQAGMRELLGQLDRRRALRCLREDLRHAVPPADTPLDEVRHRVLAEASERFADDSVPGSASRPSMTRSCSRRRSGSVALSVVTDRILTRG